MDAPQAAEMRQALATMREFLLALYAGVRSTEAQLVVQYCGSPTTFRHCTLQQRGAIKRALDRGGRAEALARFGYAKVRVLPKERGTLFHHTLRPDAYAPLLLRWDTDVFEAWPADLLNQVYLYDVVLARREAQWNNARNARKRPREEEEVQQHLSVSE